MLGFLLKVVTTVWPAKGKHHRPAPQAVASAADQLPFTPCFSVAPLYVAEPSRAISTDVDAATYRRLLRVAL